MLERLLETGAREKKSAWGATASVIVHGTIIVLAVVSTATADTIVDDHPGVVAVIPLPPVEDGAVVRTTQPGAGSTSAGTTLPDIPTAGLPTSFDPTMPLPGPVPAGVGVDTTLLSEIGGVGNGATTLGGTGIATDAILDVPVRALADRAPAYPEILRDAGITGTVRVRFVVDTIGRAELATVRVLESSHELFTRSVLASLRQARFTPGEVAGHRVRTLVERSFRFDIAQTP